MKNQKTESRKQKTAAKTRIPRITTARQARVSDGRSVKRNTWERMYRIYGWLKNGEYPNCGRVVAEFEVERKTALRDIVTGSNRRSEFEPDGMGVRIEVRPEILHSKPWREGLADSTESSPGKEPLFGVIRVFGSYPLGSEPE